MSVSLQTEIGTITYTDDFIATVAGISASECYGIVGMSAKRTTDGIFELLKRENMRRGVAVSSDGEGVCAIDLYIIVEYGISIKAVSSNVISTVKYNVEKATGLEVTQVNVNVTGIRV